MEIELTKSQQRRVDYHMKRAEKEIEDIKKKHYIRKDTILADKYILQRKLVITVMKSVMRDVLQYLAYEDDVLLDKEADELLHLARELRDKIKKADDKLEDIYINFIRTREWEKWHCRDLTNQDS